MKKLSLIGTALLAVLAFSQPAFAKPDNIQPKTTKTIVSKTVNKINLNTAGAKEIADVLTGIGMKKAIAIVDYRKAHGKFEKVEELAAVKGIGVGTIAKNEDRIILK
ncbi:ComEA family DNA-binding protein [Aliikangiella coralliicola]|uniref:Competence protein ComEA n=1 Tax=Aliikangiella coralliicola TaxID=2592383 RepID=A0A545U4U9_9GAMM|nr:helix-hairpin-helix domain-containing protein [Aliikangiella coralliicola]TQV84500.1 competence protein ComEA [Aliikangiella coralliicola]